VLACLYLVRVNLSLQQVECTSIRQIHRQRVRISVSAASDLNRLSVCLPA
jgi:hypothetical protein